MQDIGSQSWLCQLTLNIHSGALKLNYGLFGAYKI